MPGTKHPSIGISALLASTFLYGSFGVLSRIIGLHFPFFYQSLLRNLIATTLFALLIYMRSEWKPIRSADKPWIVARAVAGFIAFIAFFVSVNYLPIGMSYFIFYVGSTISAYILGVAFFREKITRVKLVSLLIALIGLSIIYMNDIKEAAAWYAVLAFVSGTATAVWNTFSKKVSDRYSVSMLGGIDNGLAALAALVLSFVMREVWFMPTLTQLWGANVLMGIFFFFTSILVVVGFYHLETTIGSLVMLTEIVFAAVFARVFWGEALTVTTMLGGSLIIAAILLPEIRGLRKESAV